MDPNIYFAYMCLTNNNSDIRKAFGRWRKHGGKNIYSPPNSELHSRMHSVCWKMAARYRKLYIYEAEKAWDNFDINTFMLFLERYGFVK